MKNGVVPQATTPRREVGYPPLDSSSRVSWQSATKELKRLKSLTFRGTGGRTVVTSIATGRLIDSEPRTRIPGLPPRGRLAPSRYASSRPDWDGEIEERRVVLLMTTGIIHPRSQTSPGGVSIPGPGGKGAKGVELLERREGQHLNRESTRRPRPPKPSPQPSPCAQGEGLRGLALRAGLRSLGAGETGGGEWA
jgi:hypothetical protein